MLQSNKADRKLSGCAAAPKAKAVGSYGAAAAFEKGLAMNC